MGATLNLLWAATASLLWVRLTALFFLTPIFTGLKVPPSVVAVFLLVLAGVLACGDDVRPYVPNTAGHFVMAALAELVTGAVMGYALQCVFAAVSMAGQILDIQLGFSMGSIFDPVMRARSPVLGSIFSLFAAAIFFTLDAHLALLKGLRFTLAQLPVGDYWFMETPALAVGLFGHIFVLALMVIAPALAFMLLLELALAVVSRALPQFNIFFVGLPVKTLAGLGVLALTANAMPLTIAQGFTRAFQFWSGALR